MKDNFIIRTEHLIKRVETPDNYILTILNDINFSLASSQALAIVGTSGSGKSTLLGLLAGLDVPNSGRVILDGVDLQILTEDERAKLRNERVGFVFQNFHLLPNLTALENIMLPLELGNHPKPRETALAEIKAVGLGHRIDHYPNQLSGGEQQRVAIARAFVSRPKILFADEPTGNLDNKTSNKISDLLFEMKKTYGTTLVLVTHDKSLAKRCNRTLTLEEGRLSTSFSWNLLRS
ncbi:ABC transporter ATP-binding protein [Candidatus Nitrosacidococcus sp. I8]|uniref:ABC transporter ATP-binding protein n=1 Tax=Candidatus Nitrosacidococcus sp. I8 TaxID=2942908 RepID=UPI00222760C1|nr:ABC transporter ATP-binding protein [Candidatus Nitrosacidococcus sp. I8]CAH9017685.1 Lipoprotein-releasing system ATP-binding protein LolD [Candidatus Nitrosacidococcus sp. I8]